MLPFSFQMIAYDERWHHVLFALQLDSFVLEQVLKQLADSVQPFYAAVCGTLQNSS
jgi:hypothetical protein